jgi:hypothetical protein
MFNTYSGPGPETIPAGLDARSRLLNLIAEQPTHDDIEAQKLQQEADRANRMETVTAFLGAQAQVLAAVLEEATGIKPDVFRTRLDRFESVRGYVLRNQSPFGVVYDPSKQSTWLSTLSIDSRQGNRVDMESRRKLIVFKNGQLAIAGWRSGHDVVLDRNVVAKQCFHPSVFETPDATEAALLQVQEAVESAAVRYSKGRKA